MTQIHLGPAVQYAFTMLIFMKLRATPYCEDTFCTPFPTRLKNVQNAG